MRRRSNLQSSGAHAALANQNARRCACETSTCTTNTWARLRRRPDHRRSRSSQSDLPRRPTFRAASPRKSVALNRARSRQQIAGLPSRCAEWRGGPRSAGMHRRPNASVMREVST
jgi:hypothetical protein